MHVAQSTPILLDVHHHFVQRLDARHLVDPTHDQRPPAAFFLALCRLLRATVHRQRVALFEDPVYLPAPDSAPLSANSAGGAERPEPLSHRFPFCASRTEADDAESRE